MNSFDDIDDITKKCTYCLVLCGMKCSKCMKVGYCGTEHQRLHHMKHKVECFPAIEIKNEQFAFHLAATRAIKSGDVILTEHPLVISPYACEDSNIRYPICLGCCKVLPGLFAHGSQICKKCSWPLCDDFCPKIQWHSEQECNLFQIEEIKPSIFIQPNRSLPLSLVYQCIMVLRILMLKGANPKIFDKIAQFESHENIRSMYDVGVFETDVMSQFIRNVCNLSPIMYPEHLINKIHGIVMFNSVGGAKFNMPPNIACESFIYEMAGKLRHSCVPNTKGFQHGATWGERQIIAAKEIKRGEMLTACYGFRNVYWEGNVERRQGIYESFLFWCACSRCSDPTEFDTYFSAIKCKKNVNGKLCSGFYLPVNPLDTTETDPIWKCDSEQCKSSMKYSILSKTVLGIRNEILEAETIDQKLTILDKHSNVSVHTNHFTLMKLRYDLIPVLLEIFRLARIANNVLEDYVGLSTRIKEFSLVNLEVADKLAPGLSPHRGYLLFYLSQAMSISCVAGLGIATTTGLESKRLQEESKKMSLIRDEAKLILKLFPEGSQGNQFYKTLVDQDLIHSAFSF